MSHYDNTPYYTPTNTTGHTTRGETKTVYSDTMAYNPTSLAVQQSLQEIFDEFHTMITGELKEGTF